jgi:alkylation response protein AidB-like acyl-CoA dehydrogenase
MSSDLPDEYGGEGASYLEGCLIEEELAWSCASATTLGANDLASAACSPTPPVKASSSRPPSDTAIAATEAASR